MRPYFKILMYVSFLCIVAPKGDKKKERKGKKGLFWRGKSNRTTGEKLVLKIVNLIVNLKVIGIDFLAKAFQQTCETHYNTGETRELTVLLSVKLFISIENVQEILDFRGVAKIGTGNKRKI